MLFTTSISKIENDREIIRGLPLEELIATKTFLENTVFVIRGTFPTEKECILLNAMFSATIDHGVGAPSTTVARIVASTGNSLHTTLAAGILTMGDLHGSALEEAARNCVRFADASDEEIRLWLSEMKKNKKKIPGYGHKVLAVDHRAETLLRLAHKLGLAGKCARTAERIHGLLNENSSKSLPLNIDSALGALFADLGFNLDAMKGLFIFARLPGLIAHSVEQMQSGEGIKRLSAEEEVYGGK